MAGPLGQLEQEWLRLTPRERRALLTQRTKRGGGISIGELLSGAGGMALDVPALPGNVSLRQAWEVIEPILNRSQDTGELAGSPLIQGALDGRLDAWRGGGNLEAPRMYGRGGEAFLRNVLSPGGGVDFRGATEAATDAMDLDPYVAGAAGVLFDPFNFVPFNKAGQLRQLPGLARRIGSASDPLGQAGSELAGLARAYPGALGEEYADIARLGGRAGAAGARGGAAGLRELLGLQGFLPPDVTARGARRGIDLTGSVGAAREDWIPDERALDEILRELSIDLPEEQPGRVFGGVDVPAAEMPSEESLAQAFAAHTATMADEQRQYGGSSPFFRLVTQAGEAQGFEGESLAEFRKSLTESMQGGTDVRDAMDAATVAARDVEGLATPTREGEWTSAQTMQLRRDREARLRINQENKAAYERYRQAVIQDDPQAEQYMPAWEKATEEQKRAVFSQRRAREPGQSGVGAKIVSVARAIDRLEPDDYIEVVQEMVDKYGAAEVREGLVRLNPDGSPVVVYDRGPGEPEFDLLGEPPRDYPDRRWTQYIDNFHKWRRLSQDAAAGVKNPEAVQAQHQDGEVLNLVLMRMRRHMGLDDPVGELELSPRPGSPAWNRQRGVAEELRFEEQPTFGERPPEAAEEALGIPQPPSSGRPGARRRKLTAAQLAADQMRQAGSEGMFRQPMAGQASEPAGPLMARVLGYLSTDLPPLNPDMPGEGAEAARAAMQAQGGVDIFGDAVAPQGRTPEQIADVADNLPAHEGKSVADTRADVLDGLPVESAPPGTLEPPVETVHGMAKLYPEQLAFRPGLYQYRVVDEGKAIREANIEAQGEFQRDFKGNPPLVWWNPHLGTFDVVRGNHRVTNWKRSLPGEALAVHVRSEAADGWDWSRAIEDARASNTQEAQTGWLGTVRETYAGVNALMRRESLGLNEALGKFTGAEVGRTKKETADAFYIGYVNDRDARFGRRLQVLEEDLRPEDLRRAVNNIAAYGRIVEKYAGSGRVPFSAALAWDDFVRATNSGLAPLPQAEMSAHLGELVDGLGAMQLDMFAGVTEWGHVALEFVTLAFAEADQGARDRLRRASAALRNYEGVLAKETDADLVAQLRKSKHQVQLEFDKAQIDVRRSKQQALQLLSNREWLEETRQRRFGTMDDMLAAAKERAAESAAEAPAQPDPAAPGQDTPAPAPPETPEAPVDEPLEDVFTPPETEADIAREATGAQPQPTDAFLETVRRAVADGAVDPEHEETGAALLRFLGENPGSSPFQLEQQGFPLTLIQQLELSGAMRPDTDDFGAVTGYRLSGELAAAAPPLPPVKPVATESLRQAAPEHAGDGTVTDAVHSMVKRTVDQWGRGGAHPEAFVRYATENGYDDPLDVAAIWNASQVTVKGKGRMWLPEVPELTDAQIDRMARAAGERLAETVAKHERIEDDVLQRLSGTPDERPYLPSRMAQEALDAAAGGAGLELPPPPQWSPPYGSDLVTQDEWLEAAQEYVELQTALQARPERQGVRAQQHPLAEVTRLALAKVQARDSRYAAGTRQRQWEDYVYGEIATEGPAEMYQREIARDAAAHADRVRRNIPDDVWLINDFLLMEFEKLGLKVPAGKLRLPSNLPEGEPPLRDVEVLSAVEQYVDMLPQQPWWQGTEQEYPEIATAAHEAIDIILGARREVREGLSRVAAETERKQAIQDAIDALRFPGPPPGRQEPSSWGHLPIDPEEAFTKSGGTPAPPMGGSGLGKDGFYYYGGRRLFGRWRMEETLDYLRRADETLFGFIGGTLRHMGPVGNAIVNTINRTGGFRAMPVWRQMILSAYKNRTADSRAVQLWASMEIDKNGRFEDLWRVDDYGRVMENGPLWGMTEGDIIEALDDGLRAKLMETDEGTARLAHIEAIMRVDEWTNAVYANSGIDIGQVKPSERAKNYTGHVVVKRVGGDYREVVETELFAPPAAKGGRLGGRTTAEFARNWETLADMRKAGFEVMPAAEAAAWRAAKVAERVADIDSYTYIAENMPTEFLSDVKTPYPLELPTEGGASKLIYLSEKDGNAILDAAKADIRAAQEPRHGLGGRSVRTLRSVSRVGNGLLLTGDMSHMSNQFFGPFTNHPDFAKTLAKDAALPYKQAFTNGAEARRQNALIVEELVADRMPELYPDMPVATAYLGGTEYGSMLGDVRNVAGFKQFANAYEYARLRSAAHLMYKFESDLALMLDGKGMNGGELIKARSAQDIVELGLAPDIEKGEELWAMLRQEREWRGSVGPKMMGVLPDYQTLVSMNQRTWEGSVFLLAPQWRRAKIGLFLEAFNFRTTEGLKLGERFASGTGARARRALLHELGATAFITAGVIIVAGHLAGKDWSEIGHNLLSAFTPGGNNFMKAPIGTGPYSFEVNFTSPILSTLALIGDIATASGVLTAEDGESALDAAFRFTSSQAAIAPRYIETIATQRNFVGEVVDVRTPEGIARLILDNNFPIIGQAVIETRETGNAVNVLAAAVAEGLGANYARRSANDLRQEKARERYGTKAWYAEMEPWMQDDIRSTAGEWTDERFEAAHERGDEWAQRQNPWRIRQRMFDEAVQAIAEDVEAGKLSPWQAARRVDDEFARRSATGDLLAEAQGLTERAPADTPEGRLVQRYYAMLEAEGEKEQSSAERQRQIDIWIAANAKPGTPEGEYLLRNTNRRIRFPVTLARALQKEGYWRLDSIKASQAARFEWLQNPENGDDAAVERYAEWLTFAESGAYEGAFTYEAAGAGNR